MVRFETCNSIDRSLFIDRSSLDRIHFTVVDVGIDAAGVLRDCWAEEACSTAPDGKAASPRSCGIGMGTGIGPDEPPCEPFM